MDRVPPTASRSFATAALDEVRINLDSLKNDIDDLKKRMDRMEEDQEKIRNLQLALDAQREAERNEAHLAAQANFRSLWQDFFTNYDHGSWNRSSGSGTRYWHKKRLGTLGRAQKRALYISCIVKPN